MDLIAFCESAVCDQGRERQRMGTAVPRTVAWGLALLGIAAAAAAVELVVPLGESFQTFGYYC